MFVSQRREVETSSMRISRAVTGVLAITAARMELTSSILGNDFMEMIVKQSAATLLLIICYASCSRKYDVPRQANPGNLAAFSDYRSQAPGIVHHIRIADLPDPYATTSANNGPKLIPRPENAWPQAPPGFRVQLYASGFDNPRLIRTAPNGDVFLAESASGKILVLRGIIDDGTVRQMEVFASGLNKPFGIGFYPPGPEPQWVYVANTDSVVRFPYHSGDLKARGAQELVTSDIPNGGLLGGGGHSTRDIAFSSDGKMFVSVGSRSNDAAVAAVLSPLIEHHRADSLEFKLDGSAPRVYAWGVRNAVGIAVQPTTGQLWASVNERDGLGDNLPPDYITHVKDGGFYGWPWFYMGGHQDPKHSGEHSELRGRVITPDVLLQPHNASLEMTFYEGTQFPAEFNGDIFAAEHGSWNRGVRTGYEVIRVPLHQTGKATGEYEDFLTGFITSDGKVWGRPVGVAVAQDGSLLVSDDGARCVWRVVHEKKARLEHELNLGKLSSSPLGHCRSKAAACYGSDAEFGSGTSNCAVRIGPMQGIWRSSFAARCLRLSARHSPRTVLRKPCSPSRC